MFNLHQYQSLNLEKIDPYEATKPANEVQQATIAQDPPTFVFKNSETIREDQIQNAIKFLSNPRVRGSPVIHRRSFLERKGLTKEEIDEAFRRVPLTVFCYNLLTSYNVIAFVVFLSPIPVRVLAQRVNLSWYSSASQSQIWF
ncbi:unnamed protein product [Arabidopsis thaliana]|uniref:Peroxisomal membrane protein PEX14 n=1 Tax=Arabidopsis thaliana TaxID=3702 RepID=A0A7G2EQU1_ARATH|nr:unnamed protein product [Arabidopsis thaliana]